MCSQCKHCNIISFLFTISCYFFISRVFFFVFLSRCIDSKHFFLSSPVRRDLFLWKSRKWKKNVRKGESTDDVDGNKFEIAFNVVPKCIRFSFSTLPESHVSELFMVCTRHCIRCWSCISISSSISRKCCYANKCIETVTKDCLM